MTTGAVPPGGETEVKVTYRSKGSPGKFKKTVWVETNDPDNRRFSLVVTGYVKGIPRPKVSIKPMALDLGEIEVGDQETLQITIRNTGELPLAVVGAEASGLEILPPFVADSIAPSDSATMRFLFVAKEPEVVQKFVIVETNDPIRPKTYIRVAGVVKGRTEEAEEEGGKK